MLNRLMARLLVGAYMWQTGSVDVALVWVLASTGPGRFLGWVSQGFEWGGVALDVAVGDLVVV